MKVTPARTSRRVKVFAALAAVLAVFLMVPPTASAQTYALVDEGVWDSAEKATGSCASGTLTRVCSYEVESNTCTEQQINTGANISISSYCYVHLWGYVQVQPVLSSTGQVIGCTSVVDTETAYGTYHSGAFGLWNVDNVPLTMTVHSSSHNQSNAVVKFINPRKGDQSTEWHFDGTLVATCAPSMNSYGGTTSGTVTVNKEVA